MGKIAQTTISFDRDFLSKLKKDPNSCVEIQKDVKRLPIHPFRLTDINTSLKDIFQTQIAKYDEKLSGILLGYQNVRLLECDRDTFDGSFSNVDIEAEFYVFKPVIGNVLTGIINKKSKDHIGCLVYDTFNVSLPRPKGTDNWLGRKAQIGGEVKFKITFTDFGSKLPYIRGEIESLVCDDSGFSTEDCNLPQNTIIKFDGSDEDLPAACSNVEEMPPPKKKKKLTYTTEHYPEEMEVDQQQIDIVKKHKKKKHKHSKSDLDFVEETEQEQKHPTEEESFETLPKTNKRTKSKKHDKSLLENEDHFETSGEHKTKHKSKKTKFEKFSAEIQEIDLNKNRKPPKMDSDVQCVVEKSKKHKKKKHEEAQNMGILEDDSGENVIKLKRKKHKQKHREDDVYDPLEEITEGEHRKKLKKHKKKKHRNIEDE